MRRWLLIVLMLVSGGCVSTDVPVSLESSTWTYARPYFRVEMRVRNTGNTPVKRLTADVTFRDTLRRHTVGSEFVDYRLDSAPLMPGAARTFTTRVHAPDLGLYLLQYLVSMRNIEGQVKVTGYRSY